MEENLTLQQQILSIFQEERQDIKTYSPLALAYIGDSAYEMIIRTVVLAKGNKQPEKLHKQVIKLVKAETQCKLFGVWEEELTEIEKDMLRRGRNAKSYMTPKNASVSDYRKASGVETLFGYWYLTDQMPRAITFLKMGLERANIEI